MKLYSQLFSIFIILFITSCTQSEIIEDAPEQVNYSLSQEKATQIAISALMNLNKTSENTATRSTSRDWRVLEILHYKSTITRTFSDNIISFYIINFEQGGFAIVPTDKRATDIYALSTEGYFNSEVNDNTQYFMTLASEYLEEEISSASYNGGSLEIIPTYDPDDPRNYMVVDHGGQQCHCKTETTTSEPFYLLKTCWHQGEPYRHFCFTDSGKNAVAGCVPIAIAQIMAYHKKPESYNGHIYLWNQLSQYSSIPAYSSIADNVAYLVHDIGNSSSTNYGELESGTSLNKAVTTFRKFGFSTAVLGEYYLNPIIDALDASHPILMTGYRFDQKSNTEKGHSWVLDGYYCQVITNTYYYLNTTSIYDKTTEVKYFLHCNWGWGDDNAYCLSKVFKVNDRNYDRKFSIIYNIY